MGNGVQKGQNSEILSHSVRYGMYVDKVIWLAEN